MDTIICKNREGWQLIINITDAANPSITLVDNFTDDFTCEKPVSHILLTEIPDDTVQQAQTQTNEPRNAVIDNYLLQHAQAQNAKRIPANFEVIAHEGAYIVVFTPYGLRGGFNFWAALASGVKIASGVACIALVPGAGVIVGSTLLSAGINSMAYTIQSGDNFDTATYMKKSAIGAVTGLATGGTGAAMASTQVFANATANAAFNGAVTGVAGQVANTGARAAAARDIEVLKEGLSPGNLAISAASGGLAGGMGQAVGAKVGGACKKIGSKLSTRQQSVVRVASGAVTGAAAGGASASTATVARNVLRGDKWSKNLSQAAALGTSMGAVIGGTAALKKELAPAKKAQPKPEPKKPEPKRRNTRNTQKPTTRKSTKPGTAHSTKPYPANKRPRTGSPASTPGHHAASPGTAAESGNQGSQPQTPAAADMSLQMREFMANHGQDNWANAMLKKYFQTPNAANNMPEVHRSMNEYLQQPSAQNEQSLLNSLNDNFAADLLRAPETLPQQALDEILMHVRNSQDGTAVNVNLDNGRTMHFANRNGNVEVDVSQTHGHQNEIIEQGMQVDRNPNYMSQLQAEFIASMDLLRNDLLATQPDCHGLAANIDRELEALRF